MDYRNKPRRKRSPIWLMPTEQFKELVRNAKSLSEIALYFGLGKKGGNLNTIKQRISYEQIDRSHLGTTNKGRKFENRNIPNEIIFVEKSKYSRGRVKNIILKQNLIQYECEKCGLKDEWKNEKLVLVLDHINGIPDDHRLENLRFLCPNCNSQTPTFAGKNQRKQRNCTRCGKAIDGNKNKMCRECYSLTCIEYRHKERELKHGKILDKINKEQLLIDIQNMSMHQVAIKYGMSDNSIKKWCKKFDIWEYRKNKYKNNK